MSYSLGQAKWIPGQIDFTTTRTGRLPSVQPLIEAGLPYAPYIEHGSWITGRPDIARYGRDPYRGISGLGAQVINTDMPARRMRRPKFKPMRYMSLRPRAAMGDTLTDWACDSQQFAQSWSERLNTSLNVGTQAAVLGAGVAGFVGAILGRPVLGMAVGAAIGWGTHGIWTAPHRVG